MGGLCLCDFGLGGGFKTASLCPVPLIKGMWVRCRMLYRTAIDLYHRLHAVS